MPTHKEMLKQSWSQLNLRESWLFTHIANTILDTKVPVMHGTKDQKTTLRTELSWLVDNFKALHNLNARFRPGIDKVQTEGDLLGILRRAESNSAAAATAAATQATEIAHLTAKVEALAQAVKAKEG